MSIRGSYITIEFAPFVWKQLVGEPLGISDLKQIDYSVYRFFKYLRNAPKEDLEGPNKAIFQKFTINLSDNTTISLKKDGENIDVTYENRNEYITLAEKARLEESKIQLKAIKKGIFDIIPSSLLRILTWQDLQWRVCGRPTVDIQLLRRHTEYSGINPNALYILNFWEVLESFTQEERRAFLRFAWAQERLP